MPRKAIFSIAALCSLCAPIAAENPDAAPGHIAKLVKQLGSPKFTEREAATKALDAIGDPAVAGLQSACNSSDAETRGRATDLLKRIGHRALVARILKPTTVALDFDNTPLEEAVKKLSRDARMPLELPMSARYVKRKVTVKSEPLPVWEALELFCRKADLHEWDPSVPPPNGVAPTTQVIGPGNVVIGGVQGQVIINGRVARSSIAAQNEKVALLDGPGASPNVHHAGAVRLRLLPAGTPIPGLNSDNTLWPLQVSAEPRVQFGGIMAVRIEKAIDGNGTPLEAIGVIAPYANNDQVVFLQMANGLARAQSAGAGVASLRLVRPDKSVKTIRQITGEMSAQMRLTEPLAQIEGPLKSGANVNGTAGVSLKVVECAPEAGEVKLTVELNVPPDVQPNSGFAANGGRIVAQGGLVFQQQIMMNAGGESAALPAGTNEFVGVALEDKHGTRWTATHGQQESMRLGPDGLTCRLLITYKAPTADAAAARLVFRGSRPVVIAIPFTFRDVPAP
jgi:hypothetical protein